MSISFYGSEKNPIHNEINTLLKFIYKRLHGFFDESDMLTHDNGDCINNQSAAQHNDGNCDNSTVTDGLT